MYAHICNAHNVRQLAGSDAQAVHSGTWQS